MTLKEFKKKKPKKIFKAAVGSNKKTFFQKIQKVTTKVKNEHFMNKIMNSTRQNVLETKNILLEKIQGFIRTLGVGKINVIGLDNIIQLLQEKKDILGDPSNRRRAVCLLTILVCLFLERLQKLDPKTMVESGTIHLENILRRKDFQDKVRFFVTKMNEFDWVQISKTHAPKVNSFTTYISTLRDILNKLKWDGNMISSQVKALNKFIVHGLPQSVKNVKEIRSSVRKMFKFINIIRMSHRKRPSSEFLNEPGILQFEQELLETLQVQVQESLQKDPEEFEKEHQSIQN
jgi:hypothetical protein